MSEVMNEEQLKLYESQLKQMTLFELRYIAREAGVSNPTKPKKDELIRRVLAIKTGKEQPVPVSKLGRPVKPIGGAVMTSPKPFSIITVAEHNSDGSVRSKKSYTVLAEEDVKGLK